jgi:thiamine biosynthesis lipoprotein
MKRGFVVTAIIAVICLLTACGRGPAPDQRLHQSQLLSLGTLVDISLWDVDEASADSAIHAIDEQLQDFGHHWHAWLPGRLHDINTALANGQSVELSDTELKLLRQATTLAEQSGQLFNPAIGRLIALWGFHSDAPEGPPPGKAAINRLVEQHPSMADLRFANHTLSTVNPMVQLDVGAFAKGFAVDEAIDLLKQRGINNAIVNAGGDLRAIGRHGDRPWRIGIRHPREPGVIAAVNTSGDESIFTSGNYERYYDYDGHRYHHIIDPRSGHPSQGTLSVTVINDNAATADAAATALMIAGPEDWIEVARRMGIDKAMLIDDQMTVYLTPAMQQRVELKENLKTVVTGVKP